MPQKRTRDLLKDLDPLIGRTRPPAPTSPTFDPFVTGSHAYGTPHEKSDIDLVVRMDPDLLDFFSTVLPVDIIEESYECQPSRSFRLGPVNLICCTTDLQYNCWQEGTLRLISEKPVTRQRAIQVMSEIRESNGLG